VPPLLPLACLSPPPQLLLLAAAPTLCLQDSRSNCNEARQWLINSIAGLELQDPGTQRRRFAQFLPGGAACRGKEHQALALAALQLLFESSPAEVGQRQRQQQRQ
jgi:hypothetical protein